MRRSAITALMATAVGMAAAGTSLAGAGADAGEGHGRQTFTVFATTPPGRIALLPVTQGRFSLGDRIVLSDDVFSSKGGNSLGTDGLECTVVRITDAASGSGILQCVVTFSLPGGQIATQALNTLTNGAFAGNQTAAITGGTGQYRDASGEISIEFLSPTEANITFSLDN